MRFSICLLPFSALLLTACREKIEKPDIPAPEPDAVVATEAPSPSKEEQEKIAALEREIASSQSIIQDLEAAVLMERSKLEDDPEYDQTFLMEVLEDQQREQDEIDAAQKQIEALTRSKE